jgi:hypothetical protein
MFERETAFYEENREKLREQHLGKHVVIVGEQILGVYDTAGEAYEETKKTIEPGKFMIKEIPENPEDEVISLSPFAYA